MSEFKPICRSCQFFTNDSCERHPQGYPTDASELDKWGGCNSYKLREDIGRKRATPTETDAWRCEVCGEEFQYLRNKWPRRCPNPNCREKGLFKALTGPLVYFEKEKFIPKFLADKIKEKHRFATHQQSHVMWIYGDGVYRPSGGELIRFEAREALGDLAKEAHVNEVVRHIEETTYTEPEKFEQLTHLVNVKNGVLNIETGELTPHSPDIIFLNELPVEYIPNAECPGIMKFLSEVLHPDDIPLIQEIAGYCLLRDYPLAKAVMLLGSGFNGKSTLLGLITALLGEENVASPSLQDLIYNRFAKASLYGKLANIHADIPAIRLKHTGIFKMLTGQDLIFAEQKHKDPFTFRNYAKLLYSANELPQTDDTSEAFWGRWIVIDFPNVFPPGDPKTDPNILEKLTTPEELSGFLNWALEGLKRLLGQGFTMTKTRKQIEEEWIARTDSLRAFVMEHVSPDPMCYVTKEQFYETYRDFCSEHDLTPVEKSMVGRRLPVLVPRITEFTPKINGKRVRSWKGIRLSEPYRYVNRATDVTDATGKSHIFPIISENSNSPKPTENSGYSLLHPLHPPHEPFALVEFLIDVHTIVFPDPDTEKPRTYGPWAAKTFCSIPRQLAWSLERRGAVKIQDR